MKIFARNIGILMYAILLASCQPCLADTKISQLPLGTASSTTSGDSFPFVNTSISTTQRLTLYDIIHIPNIATPTFSGTVTCPTLNATNANITSTISAGSAALTTPLATGYGGTGASSLTGAGIYLNGGNSFGTGAALGTNDNNSLSIKSNNTTAMTVTTGQNVGIGQSTSSTRLTLGAVDNRSSGSTTLSGLTMQRADNTGTEGLFRGNDTNTSATDYWENMIMQVQGGGGNLVFVTSSNERMRVRGNGAVGIGNQSPSALLTLGTAGTTAGTLSLAGSSSGTITVGPQAAAGTYNFNLPTTAGSSGQALLSGGGGAAAMTFGALSNIAGTITSGQVTTSTFVAPTFQILKTGTTYTTPTSPRTPLYLRIRMVGGGGGGGASGSSGGSAGGAGGTTTFGGILTATGGGNPGVGGFTSSGGAGSGGNILNAAGERGIVAGNNTITGSYGGNGGSSLFGAGGLGGTNGGGSGNSAPIANSGSGGGGAGGNGAGVYEVAGGGAGGYVEHIITSPAATYTYGIGAGGTGSTAGTNGGSGGNGADGQIIVEEFYQ